MKKITRKLLPIYIVAQPKGGVGKTTISQQILPAMLKLNPDNVNKQILIFEFDNNANKRIEYTDKSNIVNKTFTINYADNILEGLSLDILSSDDLIVIVDCGGSGDTHKVLEALNNNDFYDCHYCIPTLAGDDPLSLIALAKKIKDLDPNGELNYFLNRCRELNSNVIAEDFWQVFGDSEVEELIDNQENLMIDNLYFVPELNIFSKLLKLRTSLIDIVNKNLEMKPNIMELRIQWKKEGTSKQFFGMYKFGAKCVDNINEILNFNKKISLFENNRNKQAKDMYE